MYYYEISATIAIILSLIGVFYSIRNAILSHKANQHLKTQIFEKRKYLIKELQKHNSIRVNKKNHILITEHEFDQIKRYMYNLSKGSKYDKQIKQNLAFNFKNPSLINYLFNYCMVDYKLHLCD
jgi:hypothetical protein